MSLKPYLPSVDSQRVLPTTILTALLLVCCGCPPAPLSLEDQRRSVPSRWLTIEASADADPGSTKILKQQDAEAIAATVPTISTLVVERVDRILLETETAEVGAHVCGTVSEYRRLLSDATTAKIMQGRFWEPAEIQSDAGVIILSENLAQTLFSTPDVVGKSVQLGPHTLTVIGVLSDGIGVVTENALWDAYVPWQWLSRNWDAADRSDSEGFDRIRLRVDSLDQVDATKSIIERFVQRRYPNQRLVVQ